MTRAIVSLVALNGFISLRCLASVEDNQQQRSCLLQVDQHSKVTAPPRSVSALDLKAGPSALHLKAGHLNGRFVPAHGDGGNLAASLDGVCAGNHYWPSELEQGFSANALEWTKDEKSLCEHLDPEVWIRENAEGAVTSGKAVWSLMCKKGEKPQVLEPLAGVLRDPRVICQPFDENFFFGIDWLVLADQGSAKPSGKKILFDAGGTRFMDAMQFFTRHYEKRNLVFDKIYVWEAERQGHENYWEGTPPEVRQMWEPRLTFYDGIPVSADPDSENNPVNRIQAECQKEDFCAFKLDIDTPSIELPLIQQLLVSPSVAGVLDEFFFEHHVHGLMEDWGWEKDVNGTFADSYEMFTQLRRMGVRAHSWI